MNYDRRRTANMPLHKPAEADEKLGEAFRGLHSFKFAFDQMEEIPANLQPIYNQIMKATDAIAKARQETGQLREMVKRMPR